MTSAVPKFLGLAALAHINLMLIVAAVLSLKPAGCGPGPLPLGPIEVSLVPSEAPTQRAVEALKKEEKKEEKKIRDMKGQVVDLPKPIQERHPDKARFLSEYDTKVAKETKASRASRAGALRAQGAAAHRPRASVREQRRVARELMKLAMRAPKRQPELPRSALPKSDRGRSSAYREPKKRHKRSRVTVEGAHAKKASKGAKKKQVTLADLKLSDGDLAKAVGGGANDALKDVEEGKHTLLDSKRWRFASFFNRIKRQVAQNWHPNIVYRRRDPRGRVYGFKDRLTILRIKITPRGKLSGVHLEKASGVGFLDDEAVRAFRLAQPFPNPPRGLVDAKTGLISFRFGFLFEISHRPSFKVFRYR